MKLKFKPYLAVSTTSLQLSNILSTQCRPEAHNEAVCSLLLPPIDSYRDASYDNMVDALMMPKGAKKGGYVYVHFSVSSYDPDAILLLSWEKTTDVTQ